MFLGKEDLKWQLRGILIDCHEVQFLKAVDFIWEHIQELNKEIKSLKQEDS